MTPPVMNLYVQAGNYSKLVNKPYIYHIGEGDMNYMLVIDRIEADWAVIEYGKKTFNIPLSLLPQGAKEGDVINVLVTVDESAAKSRTDDIKALAKDLFED